MRTLHLVTHTHWDREWYLTFQQFRLKLVQLIDGLLDILDHDRNFKYFMLDGQTIVLDDYLLMRPEREADLRRYIKNGRIVIGPWYILPDEFLISPEATIRNLLEGDRTCRKYGSKMMVGYIPDPFGHIGQMPQILRGFGIETACVQRGLADEPCEFWWEAPDGSRVFMAYLRDGYGNAASLPTSDHERFITEVKRLRDSLIPHTQAATRNSHFLLMQGTDHMQPPADTSAAIAAARGKLDGDKLIHSTLPEYIRAAKLSVNSEQLPVVIGELRASKRHNLLPAVLSARIWIKQRNRACETLLEKWAEPFSTFASLTTNHRPQTFILHPSSFILQAWRLLMENHPHDSICGCSIDQVHDEMKVRFDQVEQIGEEITKQSLDVLANMVDTRRFSDSANQRISHLLSAIHNQQSVIRNQQSAIVVFNPIDGPRTDAVTAEIELPPDTGKFEITDETGMAIPHQTIGLGSRELIRVAMTAKELQSGFGNIHAGRVAGMVIQDISLRREGTHVFIEAILSEGGEPNLTALNRALQQIEGYFRDPTLTIYNVSARSAAATRLVFTAPDAPGHGWRTFFVHSRPGKDEAPVRLPPLARLLMPLARLPVMQKLATRPRYISATQTIGNEFFEVRVEKNGTLTILATRSGVEYRGLNRFVDGGDCGDEYNYCPPVSDRVVKARLKGVLLHSGAIQQTLEILLELRVPAELAPDRKSRSRQTVVIPITTHVSLITGVPRLDIRTEITNTAKDHRLRVHFPFLDSDVSRRRDTRSLETAESIMALHDGHFEIVQRPIGTPPFDGTGVEQPRPEVPQRAFTTVTNDKIGLMIANRGLPEGEVLRLPKSLRSTYSARLRKSDTTEIALTLLRCVGWLSRDDFANRKGHAGPFIPTPGAQMIGRWTFNYSIVPHAVGRDSIPPYHQAYAFETPMRAVSTGLHDGQLPVSGSFVSVEPREFVISAIKESDAGKGWIVRGYNVTDKEITITLTPWRKFKHIELVNLAEERLATLKPDADGSVSLTAGKHKILTVLFRE
ncbi:MAG: glycoside hydrolase family 38 C-terminal domain-containing protein [Anaerolineales bacterium]|nr:glycoside hydrolase family 38 C-terminal domain-containing protein [Anaerolineales bacterium]